jgi:hypothetical protein
MSVFVVYVKDTGHVVGAVKALGATLPTVAELVGDELPLRVSLGPGQVVSLALQAADLAVHEADDEPGVFLDPLAFGVEQVQGQAPKPALLSLHKSIKTVEFKGAGLHVEVDPKVNQDTPVRALVSYGQTATPLLRGKINKDAVDTTLVTPVDQDPHGVLLLVADSAGRLEKVQTP